MIKYIYLYVALRTIVHNNIVLAAAAQTHRDCFFPPRERIVHTLTVCHSEL